MDLRDFELLVSITLLIFGIGLTASPFLIHEHTHPGHLKLKADAQGDVSNATMESDRWETVHFEELSPPVQDAVRELIDSEGESVVFHAAELINGDETGDWHPDSEEERQAADRLATLARNDTRIIHNRTRYVLTEYHDPGGFIPVTPLVLIFGIPMVVYGAIDTWRTIRNR